MALAPVRDLRERRVSASTEELSRFETDVPAGFVLAHASAGLADSTIRNDTGHLELIPGTGSPGRCGRCSRRTPARISAGCCGDAKPEVRDRGAAEVGSEGGRGTRIWGQTAPARTGGIP